MSGAGAPRLGSVLQPLRRRRHARGLPERRGAAADRRVARHRRPVLQRSLRGAGGLTREGTPRRAAADACHSRSRRPRAWLPLLPSPTSSCTPARAAAIRLPRSCRAGRAVTIEKRRTDWFKVSDEDGRSGWAHRDHMLATLTQVGLRLPIDDPAASISATPARARRAGGRLRGRERRVDLRRLCLQCTAVAPNCALSHLLGDFLRRADGHARAGPCLPCPTGARSPSPRSAPG
jgi:hypothetical protein